MPVSAPIVISWDILDILGDINFKVASSICSLHQHMCKHKLLAYHTQRII